jgi:flagellar biogenesis protein FliO
VLSTRNTVAEFLQAGMKASSIKVSGALAMLTTFLLFALWLLYTNQMSKSANERIIPPLPDSM